MSGGQIMFIGLGLVVGGLFAAFGVHGLVTNLRLLRGGVQTSAMLVGHEKRDSRDEETRRTTPFFHPIVEFTDAQGSKQRIVLQTASDRIDHAEGYPVRIRYFPEDPAAACIDTFSGMWLMVVLPLGLGLIILSVAALIWVYDIPVKMN